MNPVLRSITGNINVLLHSIRFRLTLWFVLMLAIVLAAFSTLIYYTQSRDLQVDAVGRMQEKFVRVQAYFRSSAWQLSDLSPNSLPVSNVPLQKGDLLILSDVNGSVLEHWGQEVSSPDSLAQSLTSAANQRRDPTVFEETVGAVDENNRTAKTDYLFVVTPVVQFDRLLGYLIIGSKSDLITQQRRLGLLLTLGSLGMLVLAFLGGLWLADRAMRPVTAIARAARNISESDLGQRLNLKGRDELALLGGTFDSMLARLQAAFERQRRFVADASHELRTPLTIINLEVGRALSSERSAPAYRQALEVIDNEGTRMTRLVNDLMMLARMDAGQTIMKFEPVDLSEVAVEALERMAPLAEQRQIRLESGELPEVSVRGDRQYLQQLISNLVENGIKYSPAGRSVRIETGNEATMAWLRVSDTGPGIAPEHLPAVFDRFYRVDPARSQNDSDANSPTGSGLGLSIASWIVKAHRGTIRAESKVNEGTTFEVKLPRASS